MNPPIHDLRSALAFLESQDEKVIHIDQALSAELDIANHYVRSSAGIPASSVSREEQMMMYRQVKGHDIPVLMGMFGSRERNRLMLTGTRDCHHQAFLQALGKRIKPVKVAQPVCQQVVQDKDIDLLKQLPVLTLTEQDAGPYITMGLVLARDNETGEHNISIHRFCIQNQDEMTISIYPGRHIDTLYQSALQQGRSLAISINIGLDPAIYFASCLTDPLCKQGESELDVVGGLRGQAVQISDCISVDADCLSHAEIVIEAEITAQKCAENLRDKTKGTMPEFLGYQGQVPPGVEIPVVKVKAITHRQEPIFQAVVGPGLEQSELQAITPEVATKAFLMQNCDVRFKQVFYNTAGGGLLMAVLQVEKTSNTDDQLAVQAAQKVLSMVPPLKHLFLVDEDIDPYSSEDLLWALTTRYQADQDLYMVDNEKPFLMDPSQTPDYRQAAENPKVGSNVNKKVSKKALFDCTAPWAMKDRFKRPFN